MHKYQFPSGWSYCEQERNTPSWKGVFLLYHHPKEKCSRTTFISCLQFDQINQNIWIGWKIRPTKKMLVHDDWCWFGGAALDFAIVQIKKTKRLCKEQPDHKQPLEEPNEWVGTNCLVLESGSKNYIHVIGHHACPSGILYQHFFQYLIHDKMFSSKYIALRGSSMKIPCNILVIYFMYRGVYILFASDIVTTKVEHYTQQC